MNPRDVAALRVVVLGRVQGVFFRQSTRDEALRLGLRGWVRNRRDGSVEVWAEGARTALEGLLDWCGMGPPRAQVLETRAEWAAPVGEQGGFDVLRTE
jgi:acylphosphatase